MSISNGTIFLVLVIASFVVFATQAGAQESKVLRSPLTCILFLAVMGLVLMVIWHGNVVVLK